MTCLMNFTVRPKNLTWALYYMCVKYIIELIISFYIIRKMVLGQKRKRHDEDVYKTIANIRYINGEMRNQSDI